MADIALTFSGQDASLVGELTRHTVPSLSGKAAGKLFTSHLVVVNMTKVVKVDSAGLAWLLAQVEIAEAKACQLRFAHLPSELIKLARLSAVEHFLPID